MNIERIAVKGLTLEFENKPVFKDLEFSLKPGFHHLVATAGGGRSTLLRLLSGSLAPTEGQVFYNNQNVSQFTFEEWTALKLKIGYSFDFGGLLNNRSLFDNLLLPLHYHNVMSYSDAVKKVEELLTVFDLYEDRHRRPSEVTGSQRKAACVARSLVLDPQVLLLDDPTVGLKPSLMESFFRQVEHQVKHHGLTFVIYSSDDQSLLKRFSGHSIDIIPLEEAA